MENEKIVVIKIGQKIEYSGKIFVVVGAKMAESVMGMGVKFTGVDPEYADKRQQEDIKAESMHEGMIGFLNRFMGRGGDHD